MLSYDDEALTQAINSHRAMVRPIHGEVGKYIRDSHPTHRSHDQAKFLAAEQIDGKMSAPYVHQGIPNVEGSYGHDVPGAMASLSCAADLDESHFHQSLLLQTVGSNNCITTGSDPTSSAYMRYHELSKPPPQNFR